MILISFILTHKATIVLIKGKQDKTLLVPRLPKFPGPFE